MIHRIAAACLFGALGAASQAQTPSSPDFTFEAPVELSAMSEEASSVRIECAACAGSCATSAEDESGAPQPVHTLPSQSMHDMYVDRDLIGDRLVAFASAEIPVTPGEDVSRTVTLTTDAVTGRAPAEATHYACEIDSIFCPGENTWYPPRELGGETPPGLERQVTATRDRPGGTVRADQCALFDPQGANALGVTGRIPD